MMSDSDDQLPSHVYSFQNQNTAVCVKGPNINSTSVSGLNFRNNVTSTMHMPRTFEKQCYSELSFDQRSMSYRRGTSPMSMYSDIRPRNFQNSIYNQMSSQRSMYNGRSGSPMSMRSMDSNTTVSAADIAIALKNVKFNKHDLNMIKDAYNKLIKRRMRRRIEKRRNMRLLSKGNRRRSGYDSGEQGSNDDSSISSDDCRSTYSAVYRDNMSSCRPTKTAIADFRQSIQESNMYKDCTNTLKKNAFRNKFLAPPVNVNRYNGQATTHNMPMNNQRERFKNNFPLPSQRFSKSVACFPVQENDGQVKPFSRVTSETGRINVQNHTQNGNCATDSDQEEIFSEVTVCEKSILNPSMSQIKTNENKRCLAFEETECSSSKRTKLSSPDKLNKSNNINKSKSGKEKTKDFQFLKPQFPIRKSGLSKFKDKLISKSAQPVTDTVLPQETILKTTNNIPDQVTPNPLSPENDVRTDKDSNNQNETMTHSNSDMSMRPSFIKRKLFSQKMDVTERKNLNSEILNVNSPQTNMYSAIQREKNKTRKVVTNQSCLNRDVQDDNNLLDLIHKIVPPDQMNITNMTNKTSISSKPSQEDNKNDEDDKWDVSSIISTCNKDDISETYTDEDIFYDSKKKSDIGRKPVKKSKVTNKDKILAERSLESIDTNIIINQTNKSVAPKPLVHNGKCIKSFWDTDFESDLESPQPKKRWGEQDIEKDKQINSNSHQSNNKRTEEHNTNVTNNKHDTTSLSERFKPNTSILDNSKALNKKYNINRNLTIRLFKKSKNLIIDKKITAADVILSPAKNMINKSKLDKNEQQSSDNKGKIVNRNEMYSHEPNVNNIRKDDKSRSPPNTKLKDTKKCKMIRKDEEKGTPNKTRVPVTESTLKSYLQKPKHEVSHKVDVVTAKLRTLRTPKNILCCSEKSTSVEKIKSIEECKNTKINKSSNHKSTNTKNKNIPDKRLGKQPIKNKENVEPTSVNESPPIIRTLRTRKIRLSSSLNTSNENEITIRSLRTRKIDLSSSINNSSLDGNSTVLPKKILHKSCTKKSNRNETRNGRPAKKLNTKS